MNYDEQDEFPELFAKYFCQCSVVICDYVNLVCPIVRHSALPRDH